MFIIIINDDDGDDDDVFFASCWQSKGVTRDMSLGSHKKKKNIKLSKVGSLLQLIPNLSYLTNVPVQLLDEFIVCVKHEIGTTEYDVSHSHFFFIFKPT